LSGEAGVRAYPIEMRAGVVIQSTPCRCAGTRRDDQKSRAGLSGESRVLRKPTDRRQDYRRRSLDRPFRQPYLPLLVECMTIKTAQRQVPIDNAKRIDLDVIEQTGVLAGVVDEYAAAGRSQRDLADDIGVSQSEISNLTRLLKLPAVWRERLTTGGIIKTQARELPPWCDVPALRPKLEKFRDDEGPERFSRDFSQVLDHHPGAHE
jgi:hypothetical protein